MFVLRFFFGLFCLLFAESLSTHSKAQSIDASRSFLRGLSASRQKQFQSVERHVAILEASQPNLSFPALWNQVKYMYTVTERKAGSLSFTR